MKKNKIISYLWKRLTNLITYNLPMLMLKLSTKKVIYFRLNLQFIFKFLSI